MSMLLAEKLGLMEDKTVYHISGLTFVYFVLFVLIIAALVFLFVSRQILRLKSASGRRREPFTPVGHDAPASMRRDIDLKLACVQRMRRNYVPRFGDTVTGITDTSCDYRMRALDEVKQIDADLASLQCQIRHLPRTPLYTVLIQLAGVISLDNRLIHELGTLYALARYSPEAFTKVDCDSVCILVARVRHKIHEHEDRLVDYVEHDITSRQPLLSTSLRPPKT